jgi:hypothetical protein
MEDELWRRLYPIAGRLGSRRCIRRGVFSDVEVVLVLLWAVLHERPIVWACRSSNWPLWRQRTRLPTCSTMSRRLRSHRVQELLIGMERHWVHMHMPSLCRWIDAKPLPIGGSSQDRESGYGRAAGTKAKGYKLYAIADSSQGFVTWAIRPMNVNEVVVAQELIGQLDHEGYLVGDNAYDANRLYEAAAGRCVQLIAPQRKGTCLAHIRHSRFRLRAIELLRRPFGQALLNERDGIERMFAQLTNFGGGLAPLPNWVRGRFRVELWIRAKMIIYNLWRHRPKQVA